MHLHVANSPRALYLVTSSHDERQGRPRRVLVFRPGERHNQAVVEFLPKDEVDLNHTVRLTNKVIKGCLGLILIDNGAPVVHKLTLIKGDMQTYSSRL